MKFRIVGVAVVLAAGLAGTAAGLAQVQPSGPVPPPPPTPIVNPVPTPPGGTIPATAAPTLAPNIVPTLPPPATPPPGERGRRRGEGAPVSRSSAKPGATPAPPQFTNLNGVWEVQVQPGARTFYSHLYLKQNADNTLTGYWETDKKEKLPISGSFDGKQFKITAQDGKTQDTFAGYEDNFSDMVGLLEMADAKQPVAFTAAHRAKTGGFLNNLNIGVPSGLGGSSGGPGGGL